MPDGCGPVPLTIVDRGVGNHVDLGDADPAALQGTIVLQGDRNRVTIGQQVFGSGVYVELGSGGVVTIGDRTVLHDLFVYALSGASVVIESDVSFNARVRLLLHEPSSIAIGRMSLIASDVDLMTSDMHSILDDETGQRVNPARSIVVGKQVWIGQRAMVLKGSIIGAGSVIAAGSIVAGRVPEKVIAAGNPAKVVRTGIRWQRDLL